MIFIVKYYDIERVNNKGSEVTSVNIAQTVKSSNLHE